MYYNLHTICLWKIERKRELKREKANGGGREIDKETDRETEEGRKGGVLTSVPSQVRGGMERACSLRVMVSSATSTWARVQVSVLSSTHMSAIWM